jgi:hypothetical protein
LVPSFAFQESGAKDTKARETIQAIAIIAWRVTLRGMTVCEEGIASIG